MTEQEYMKKVIGALEGICVALLPIIVFLLGCFIALLIIISRLNP